MSIISHSRPTTSNHADHAAWCSLVGSRHDSCFSDYIDTPVGSMWIAAEEDGSPVLIADTSGSVSMSPGDAMQVVAGITRNLAAMDAAAPAAAPPLAADLADAVTTMSESAAVQLLAVLAARVAGGAR